VYVIALDNNLESILLEYVADFYKIVKLLGEICTFILGGEHFSTGLFNLAVGTRLPKTVF